MSEFIELSLMANKEKLTMFDLPWRDLLVPHILCYLSLKDLFSLRCCSTTAKELAETALERRKIINLTDNNSSHIEVAFAVLSQCCKHLECLEMMRCLWLTDELLVPILNYNKLSLRVVNLNECLNVTSTSLQSMIVCCKKLRVLKLSRCQWLTAASIDALTLHNNSLEVVDISNCSTIGERCLLIFFRKLKKLTMLSLAYTPAVTDRVLIMIANYCRQLQHINLVGCSAISDYGVQVLTKNCTNLKSLMIQNCMFVTERTLTTIRGRIHIDRPIEEAGAEPESNRLYLQV